jgi:circadian clock protein KaiC
MTKTRGITRLETGVRNLDVVLGGGVPKRAVIVIAGPPGSGKTILAQQICFHNAGPSRRVLYFNTLSEPTAKTLHYLGQFDFFDPKKFENSVWFVDLGELLRTKGLEKTAPLIMKSLKEHKPDIVVIDSFKVFDDLAKSPEELRKFGYELVVNLMAWETTALLLGEYGPDNYMTNPLFSIVDGLVVVTQRQSSGEQQRFMQILKLRGSDHNRDENTFVITSRGIEVYAPRVTIQRQALADPKAGHDTRCRTGISKLDDLLGKGIPRGSSLLVSGVAGTGKTLLLLEFIYRGALAGEKGVLFSFEETQERLRATARALGWNLEELIRRGMMEIVFIPQPNILVEKHLLMMRERVAAMDARRVAVDSVSVFLHKVQDPQSSREKIFQLASIVQNAQAVGFFATDIPYGCNQISRFGVEETVVDGVILLSSPEEGRERARYIEIYKLRNTAHLRGRHDMSIGPQGMEIFPRYAGEVAPPVASLQKASRASRKRGRK